MIESDDLAFRLFTMASTAKEKPANMPQKAPLVIEFEKSKSGITSTTPQKTVNATKISMGFSFSLKKKGSIKVTNNGNVENVTRPTATLESCIE